MQKVVEFLQANPVQYLATVGRDGKAKCRPFMFCFEQDGKLWFCTNNTKDVYKDMLENPEILQKMVHETGAHSTDVEQEEPVEHLCGKCVDYAKDWKETADKLWAAHPYKQKGYTNFKKK